MKSPYIFFLSITIVNFLVCCDIGDNNGSTLVLNDTIQLSMHDTLYNYQKQIGISMDSVISDSRCPVNVMCFWAGNAEVRFTFFQSDQKTTFKLNTHGGTSFKSDSTINGYNIKLLDLLPYPPSDTEIPQNTYYSLLRIE